MSAIRARNIRPRALDLGCGAGVYAAWLARQGFEVTGIDIIPKAIALATAHAASTGVVVDFVEADLLAWSSDRPFDLVLDILDDMFKRVGLFVVLVACGGSGDGADAGDASADSSSDGPKGDTSTSAGCSGHTFCDDFESGPLGSKWSAGAGSQFATFALETDQFVSPTHAARVTVTPNDAGVGSLSMLDTIVGPAASGVRCTWQIMIEQGDPTKAQGNALASLSLKPSSGSPESSYVLMASLVGGQVWMGENITFTDGGIAPANIHKGASAPGASWTQLLIDVDFPSRMITLGVGSDVETYPGSPPASASPVELVIEYSTPKGESWTVDFDDVICDTR